MALSEIVGESGGPMVVSKAGGFGPVEHFNSVEECSGEAMLNDFGNHNGGQQWVSGERSF